MADVVGLSPETARRVRELIDPDGGPGRYRPVQAPDVVIARCGTLVSSSPRPYYAARVRRVPGLTGAEDAGAEDVYLTNLAGGTLSPGADYEAVRAGQVGSVPLYWASPEGYFARLTTSSGGKWKWVRLTLDASGAWVDDGAESAAFDAVPSTRDGTLTDPPAAGMRVWVVPSKRAGFHEFLPLARSPSAFKLTEATGAASGVFRQLDGSFAWSDGATLTDVVYPVEVDGAAMAAKPTANGLIFPDPARAGKYDFVPYQYAGLVSGTYYPGMVSTAAQAFAGWKTFHSNVTVQAQSQLEGGCVVGLTSANADLVVYGTITGEVGTAAGVLRGGHVKMVWPSLGPNSTFGLALTVYDTDGSAFADQTVWLTVLPPIGGAMSAPILFVDGGVWSRTPYVVGVGGGIGYGQSGTLGYGAVATGGIITDLGTGTADLADALDALGGITGSLSP